MRWWVDLVERLGFGLDGALVVDTRERYVVRSSPNGETVLLFWIRSRRLTMVDWTWVWRSPRNVRDERLSRHSRAQILLLSWDVGGSSG